MCSSYILGIVQGLTEFLPVSSSGHLALTQIFIGTEMPPLAYDLLLHVATTLAIIVFFFKEIVLYLKEWCSGFVSPSSRNTTGWRVGWAVFASTVMTGIIGLCLKSFAEEAILNSLYVSICLIFTGVILVAGTFIREGNSKIEIKDGIPVGIAQGIAVLPGISRSGMTIMTSLFLGISREEAFTFSFLLSVPAILGAAMLEAIEVGGWKALVMSLPDHWFGGSVLSFITGFLSLILLKKMVISSKWWIFGLYCLLVGGGVFIFTFIGGLS